MADRYFIEQPPAQDRALLVGAEAHHLAHVMRAKSGDEVILFDGSGWEYRSCVERVGRSEIELAVIARSNVDREAAVRSTLAVALPKGDRQRYLVEKAVELGVARLVPLITDRGSGREGPAAIERLRRAVIEASKQCGRNRLMEIAAPQGLPEFLSAAAASAGARLLAHPGGENLRRVLNRWDATSDKPAEVSLAVGPEGGFSDAELHAAVALGWQAVDLGPRLLRVETAAIAMSTAVITWSE